MSTATIPGSDFSDDFERHEFDLIVADFDAEPAQPQRPIRRGRSRGDAEREAIGQSLGIRRHRSHEREA